MPYMKKDLKVKNLLIVLKKKVNLHISEESRSVLDIHRWQELSGGISINDSLAEGRNLMSCENGRWLKHLKIPKSSTVHSASDKSSNLLL